VCDVLGSLNQGGSLDAVCEQLTSFAEQRRTVAKDHDDALEARDRN